MDSVELTDQIDAGNTLRHAMGELRMLRARNEILEAQMFVVQVFAKAVGMNSSTGMGFDVLPKLEELEREISKKFRLNVQPKVGQ